MEEKLSFRKGFVEILIAYGCAAIVLELIFWILFGKGIMYVNFFKYSAQEGVISILLFVLVPALLLSLLILVPSNGKIMKWIWGLSAALFVGLFLFVVIMGAIGYGGWGMIGPFLAMIFSFIILLIVGVSRFLRKVAGMPSRKKRFAYYFLMALILFFISTIAL